MNLLVRTILIALLIAAGVGTAAWGYNEHQEKNAVLIQAENTYQRAFHELTYHVDLLHDKIGTALAVSTNERLSPELVEIWRISSESLANVGQLPLTLLPFNKTAQFLSEIGEFTYRTAVRDLENDPLSDDEISDLTELYAQAEDIQNELRTVQHAVLDEDLRWMDVQLALATQDEQMDNQIIDGFKTVEKKVEGYEEGNVESSIFGITPERETYQSITGKEITEEDALEKGKELFGVEGEEITVTSTGEGATIPMYTLSYRNEDKNSYMDMIKKGGYPVTILTNRPLGDQTLSLYEGSVKAEQYLQSFELDNMTLFQSSEYNGVGIYSFIYQDGDVRVFSDAIQMKVALDNGDILGFSGKNYFMNHYERDIPRPTLEEDEVVETLNKDLTVNEVHLAIIDDDLGEEVLVYEILGTMNDDTYRIYINAMDGAEEKVERLSGVEANFS